MNIVTGCSGIDAIAYAAELLDIDIIGQIEIDPFCNQILELRYPGVKRLNDVFDVKGDEFGTVDIFAFGDPCQPHSVAGRQRGTADERYIWPELYRIIKTMRPTWIINENVTGSVSNGVVLSKINDLENEGYRARAFIIPACGVGAPHQRYRVFIVAYSERDGFASTEGSRSVDETVQQEQAGQDNSVNIEGADSIRETLGNTERSGLSGESRRRSGQKSEDRYIEPEKDVADTESPELHRTIQPRGGEPGFADNGTLVNASRPGCEERDHSGITTNQRHVTGRHIEARADRTIKSGVGGNASGIPDRIHGSERYEDGQGILDTFEAIFTATLGQIKWPAGYGAEQHSYEPPRVIKGMKNRTNRLKALGNAIVPWQVFPFLLAIKLIGK
jgi:DNA (cytosine-5)-methyltransferase 1